MNEPVVPGPGSRVPAGRTVLCVLPVLVLIPLLFGLVQGEMVDEDLEVTYDKEEVVLAPGGETTLGFVVTNRGAEPLEVAFMFVPVDAPRHSEGYFQTVLATLQPGASKENRLVVKSHAGAGDDPDASNFVVRVLWAPDIPLDDDQQPVEDLVDGTWEHEFEVQTEAEPGLARAASILVLVVVLVIAVILLYPSWTGERTG
jgi:hypothetical protein